MATKYDSSVNVLGSIPDYSSMMDFICEYEGRVPEGQGSFSFRTHKTFSRFLTAIKTATLQFASDEHKQLFLDAISSKELSFQEKLMMLFWQMAYGNLLFRRISEEVFMKAVYQGKTTLSAMDVLALLHHIKETEKGEFDWSEATLKICASKYLTILKKLGLADGAVKKQMNPAKRNVLDLKNETCKNREKRNVLKISHTRHFKTTKSSPKRAAFIVLNGKQTAFK